MEGGRRWVMIVLTALSILAGIASIWFLVAQWFSALGLPHSLLYVFILPSILAVGNGIRTLVITRGFRRWGREMRRRDRIIAWIGWCAGIIVALFWGVFIGALLNWAVQLIGVMS